LLIVVFVEIAFVSRGNGGEATRSDQIGYEHIDILIEIEFDKQFTQGLLQVGQSNLPGCDCARCAR